MKNRIQATALSAEGIQAFALNALIAKARARSMTNTGLPIRWPLTAAEQEKLGGKKCPACKGKGYVPCSTKHQADMPPESCPICEGQEGTSVMCNECGGTGRINIKG